MEIGKIPRYEHESNARDKWEHAQVVKKPEQTKAHQDARNCDHPKRDSDECDK
jgi:hypothetical protein